MKIKKSLIFCGVLAIMGLSSCSTFQLVNSEVYNDSDLSDFHTFRIITPEADNLPPGMELVTYYNIAAAIREQMVERGYQEDPYSPIVINIGLTVNKEYQTTPIGALMPPPPSPVLAAPAPMPMPAPGPGPAPTPPPAPAPGPEGPGGGPMPSEAPVPQPRPVPAPNPHFFPYNGPAPAPAFAPYFMMPRSYYWGAGINPGTQVVTGIYKEGVLTMDIVNMETKMALYSASVATILTNGDSQFRNLKGIAEAVQTLFSKYPVPLLPQYRNNK